MALDPSSFLKCLKQIICKAWSNPAFDLFSQQDAAEIVSYILEKLCGLYMAVNLLEFISDRLPLPQHAKAPKFLIRIKFIYENDFFCKISLSNNQALADQEISKKGGSLLIKVKCLLFLIR